VPLLWNLDTTTDGDGYRDGAIAEVEPDDMPYDVRRKSVASIGNGLHNPSLINVSMPTKQIRGSKA
jgi:hypothetical protein